MRANQIPPKFPMPFAAGAPSAFIRPIPPTSQIGIVDGAASLTDGFVPKNFQPVAAGGIPPFGQDFNGIFNQITAWNQWQNLGGTVPYDPTFQIAIGGYPQGAIVASATTFGNFWLCLADNNTSNPDTGGANWLLLNWTGATTIHSQLFTTSDTFTAPLGVTKLRVQVWGAGGGGSGWVGSGPIGGGNGGGGGGYCFKVCSVVPGNTYNVIIGAGGSAGDASNSIPAGNGTAGGTSSFDAFCSATGGAPGTIGISVVGSGGNPGVGGSGVGGDINFGGCDGCTGTFVFGNGDGVGGNGGAAGGGGGGGGAGTSTVGFVGHFPGGGGGAGGYPTQAGAAGAGGAIIVQW